MLMMKQQEVWKWISCAKLTIQLVQVACGIGQLRKTWTMDVTYTKYCFYGQEKPIFTDADRGQASLNYLSESIVSKKFAKLGIGY